MTMDVSAGLIVRDKKILVTFDESREVWDVPTAAGESGELSSQTAERAVEKAIGMECEVTKYRGKLKTEISYEDELINWQPYSVEIEGEPEEGKWISLKEIDPEDEEIADPLPRLAEKMSKKF